MHVLEETVTIICAYICVCTFVWGCMCLCMHIEDRRGHLMSSSVTLCFHEAGSLPEPGSGIFSFRMETRKPQKSWFGP